MKPPATKWAVYRVLSKVTWGTLEGYEVRHTATGSKVATFWTDTKGAQRAAQTLARQMNEAQEES